MASNINAKVPITRGLILGIDLGSNSLGTALVNPEKQEIAFMGARIFPAGVVGDTTEGKEVSRSVQRREARLARRQTRRRQERLFKIFRILQRLGLMPEGTRVEVLYNLERQLQLRYSETTILPWFLRARALDHRLEPAELGRALYHLAQRRGFLSNRIGGGKEDAEERSKVKRSISGLRADIQASGKRTLGEFMNSLDPHQRRIRNNYTHRTMFTEEFDSIWAAQKPYHADLLTDANYEKLRYALFHQRPLKDQSNLVGRCELEPGEKRAPLRLLLAQRLRVLGFVNNLRLRLEDGTERKLSVGERTVLLDLCEKAEKLSFAQAKKALDLKRSQKFTIEDGGEKNVPVNLSSTRLRAALGEWWDNLTPDLKDDLVEDVGDGRRCPTDEELERCGREKWSLSDEDARRLADVRLPDAYGRFSRTALSKLIPHLEAGLTVEEAKDREYEGHRNAAEPLTLLPPVKDVLGEIRNPAVLRALTELRKTVNAIIRRYGKPEFIRIELARDLKKSRQDRQREVAQSRGREKLRELAKAELKAHDAVRFAHPRGADTEKYMLAMESNWSCPYTGRKYGFTDVFGDHPSVDIEHIIPRSRSLDDSFLNKTLAFRAANADKGDKTPREWLGESDPSRYEAMIETVKLFDRRFEVGKKLRRFAMEVQDPDSLLREFAERQLQETRYASKLAARYLGVLYGGVVDADGTRRVSACAGQVTAKLRNAWDLNRILSPEPRKSRDDHRHHAVDALTIALTSQRMVQELATAAGEADRLYRRKIILPVPWPGFAEQSRKAVEGIQVSHRPVRKLSGPLHEETNYGRPFINEKGKTCVHYRVPVSSLTSKEDIAAIVDRRVREAVLERFDALGGGGNKFVSNWPTLKTKRGGSVVIKRVRIRKVQAVERVGSPNSERYVIPGSNHHAEVLAELDSGGQIKRYRSCTVSLLEAVDRWRRQVPVVRRDHGRGFQFVCTLSEGDLVEARREGDTWSRIWRVRGVKASGAAELSPANDARLKTEIVHDKLLWGPSLGALFGRGGHKVLVNHLGEVLPAND